ncbi:MAG: InlB B-repeat-containing protein [Lachnospiraceae bacterium]
MKKKKIIIITLCSIIGLIFLDFIVALSFNNSPIIKIRDYNNGVSTIYKDKGIITNTYKCSDGKTKTVLKTTKYVCPMNDIEKDIKEAITITFDTKGGSIIDSITIGKDTELTLPKEPTRDGYVFKDWVEKNEIPIYNKVLLAENTTLYAVWEKVENKKTSPKTEEPKTNTNTNNNNSSSTNNTNKPNQNTNNNTNIDNNENTVLPEEKPPVVEKTQAEKNDEYRKQLQNKYSVKIAYKDELGNYTINGYGSDKLNDDNKINNCLGEINKTLKNYPNGFFKEMKDYGMPLTIYLVNSISGNVSGLTDAKDKSDIKIMIAPASLFENTLNHEIMHYIDSYIKVKGYSIDINITMKDVNPIGFTYGDTSNEYVYYFTSIDNAYFLSAYGKTNYLEDRAVIFSDLMTRTFAKDYYDDGTPINKKAKLISSQIKEHFNTLSNTGRYYWDRFL